MLFKVQYRGCKKYVKLNGASFSELLTEEICDHIVQPCEQTGVYKDFCDGSYYKNHPLFSKEKAALQIQLFYDDFETANPLGSKAGIHKVGSMYFVLRNLSPKINSALMNIHLVALFHTQDVKKYGFNAILEPLVKDLKVLESTGIKVPFCDKPIHGTVAQVTGDNLGMHTLLGFVESFSANFFCRLCLVDKATSQHVFSDDDPQLTLRDKTLHTLHLNEISTDPTILSSFGVKRACLLNDLQYFHVSDNYAVDIMHDILEGVGQFEIKLLFRYFSDSNIISKQDISNRIYSYNYGYVEKKNRPTRLNLEQPGNGIGLNAIQTFCLIRNIPLIFGDVVEVGNVHWSLLLLLLQIINIVFSPAITDGMTTYLKHLIVEHHKLFKELYPYRNLIPKHHFMVHYPRCIRKIGPILHVWAMRFEAKHRFFKTSIKNFKNITKSLAKRHQMGIAYHWESGPFKAFECGPQKTVKLNELSNCEAIANRLQVDIDCCINVVTWVRCSGVEYRPGLLICIKVEDMPVFSQISNIIVFDEQYFAVADDFETICFAEHLHSFHVREGSGANVSMLRLDHLHFFKPFDLQTTYGMDKDDLYVVPVHQFL